MNPSKIFVFGNPEIDSDSLPLRILPRLKKEFPEINFEIKDPNEEWNIIGGLFIIDTVEDIEKTTTFHELESFVRAPNITMHDFDAYASFKLLNKLGKLKKITIIGIPPMISETEALEQVLPTIRSTLLSKNARRRTCTDRTLE